MEHVSVSLSPEHRAFVDQQVALGEFADANAYFAALLEAQARAQAHLEELLIEGLNSSSTEWTPADSERLMRLATHGR